MRSSHEESQCKVGVQTSFFNSGAPFVMSEALELCFHNQNQVLESVVTGDETIDLYYDP
jgi:hypothetical protein